MRNKWILMLNSGNFDLQFFWNYFKSNSLHKKEVTSQIFEIAFISWFHANKSIIIAKLNTEFKINTLYNKENQIICYV